MSQKLSRTINLPKAPASFSDDQKRYMDDFARSLIGHFRDMFDLLGEDAGAMEKHLGDKTAHFMDEGNVAGVGVLRGTDGKIRFASADGTEESDDYGITAGYVSPALEHIGYTTGIHGATSVPTEGKIAMYTTGGRIKASAPTEPSDLTTKEFVENAIDGVFTRLVFRGRGYTATAANTAIGFYSIDDENNVWVSGVAVLPPGLYLVCIRIFDSGYTALCDAASSDEYIGGTGNSISGFINISESRPVCVKYGADLPAQAITSGYGLDIISL